MSSTGNIQTFLRTAWSGDVEDMAAALATVRDVNVMARLDYTTGGTALYFASHRGQLEAVRWLLAQEGIDANRGNTNGASPLHAASRCGHEAVVEALIAAGADVNHRDCWGNTALLSASAFGHPAIVQRLIAAGSRVNYVDTDGWTALDWAQAYHRPATVEVLLTHRAMPGTGTWATRCRRGSGRTVTPVRVPAPPRAPAPSVHSTRCTAGGGPATQSLRQT
jgi:hypothetical protein